MRKAKVGDKVRARVSGWTGVIVKLNKQRSSPWKVRWDKNGCESNENCMSVESLEEDE